MWRAGFLSVVAGTVWYEGNYIQDQKSAEDIWAQDIGNPEDDGNYLTRTANSDWSNEDFFFKFTNIKQRHSFRVESQIKAARMGFIRDFDERRSVWVAWLCSPREDSLLYSPGGSVVVSRQANLVQGHTAHVMSPLTWRDRTLIHDSSLSFVISYSGVVFTKC
jgi:hypothetical protein